MVEKERSTFVGIKDKKPQKVVENYAQYPVMEIIATLYEKQG